MKKRTKTKTRKPIGAVLREKWQAFRVWQEHPIQYRMDESEHCCNNCGHTFRGNYCPVCSQPAGQGRITWLSIWQGLGQLWGIESRSALYTLWQLFLRPGYLVRDFISGRRQVSYPPVKLLFILAAVVAVIQFFLPAPVKETTELGAYYVDFAFNWLNNHENVSALLSCCIFILPTWILFRKAPAYPNHTIPEGFFLQVYIAILSFIVSSVFVHASGFGMALTALYMFVTYKQLFGYGYWSTIWRFVVCTVWSLTMLLTLIIIGVLVSKGLEG